MRKINLFEADFDASKLVKSAQDVKKLIDEIREEQKRLTKEGKTSSQQFIQNAADLKTLSKEYTATISAISKHTKATADAENAEKLMALALETEVKTIQEARDQNELLNSLRNNVNATTEEGRIQVELLNEKLDENNDFIKENADAYLKQKINIGNYSESIKDAFSDLNIFNGGLSGFIQRATAAGGVTKFVTGTTKQLSKAVLGLTKSTLAFLATPLGALLALLVGAFALVKNAMNRSEEATDKMGRAFSGFGGMIQRVLKFLEPLGEFLIDGIVVGIELAEKAVYKLIDSLGAVLDFLGFDAAALSVKKFNDELKEASEESKRIEALQQKINKSQREQEGIRQRFERDAEKLRQIRDDENLSIQERIKANDNLAAKLKEQAQSEIAFQALKLELINARIDKEGEVNELLDERAEIQNNILEIENRITGQESEQLTNRVSLQREAVQQARERAEKVVEGMEQELELLREQNRFREDDLSVQKKLAQEELKINQEKFDKKLINETQFKTEKLKIENDLKEKVSENQQKELDDLAAFEERKKEMQNELALARAASDEEKAVLKAEQDFIKEEAEIEKLQLTEERKTELLKLLTEEREMVLADIKERFQTKALEDFKKVQDKELKIRQQHHNQAASIASSLTNILKGLLGDSLGAQLAGIAIDAGVQAGLVAISSSASQAKNLAQATAAAPPPFNIPFIATAIGQNAVIKANSSSAITKILASAALQGLGAAARKLEHGGVIDIGGNRHSQGGTKFFGEDGTSFEAEKDEKLFVLNRKASNALAPLLSDINQQYGGVALSNKTSFAMAGGQIARGNQPPQNIKVESGIDYDLLASKVGEHVGNANLNLPRPVVTVEDINSGQSNLAEVIDGASV